MHDEMVNLEVKSSPAEVIPQREVRRCKSSLINSLNEMSTKRRRSPPFVVNGLKEINKASGIITGIMLLG